MRELRLGGTKITDAGLTHLSGLAQLEVLNIGNTRVTDAGLQRFKGLTRLKELWLFGIFSNAAVEDLPRTSCRLAGFAYRKTGPRAGSSGGKYPWEDMDIVWLSQRFDIYGDKTGRPACRKGPSASGAADAFADRLPSHGSRPRRLAQSAFVACASISASTPPRPHCNICVPANLESLYVATHDSRGYDGHDIEALEGMEKLRSLTLWGRRISLDAVTIAGQGGMSMVLNASSTSLRLMLVLCAVTALLTASSPFDARCTMACATTRT